MEATKLIRAYQKDVDTLDTLKAKHPEFTYADCIRVCVEYSRAHGVIA